MKRLVALLLVLGLASTANAVMIQVDGVSANDVEVMEGETALITIVGDDASSWLGYIIVNDGGAGALTNVEIGPAAGDLAAAEPYSEAGWGAGYMLTAAESPGSSSPISEGSQFYVNYSSGSAGQNATISLYLDPDYSMPAASVNISIVPEPMTIALLSLGALFLRKRK